MTIQLTEEIAKNSKDRVVAAFVSCEAMQSIDRSIDMAIRFSGLPTEEVRALQASGPDAYGNEPERRISDGEGTPCRHCLRKVAKGEPYLVLAYRPFQSLQPYAETGPIFLHANECESATPDSQLPEILSSSEYIVRGYDEDERIVYGTGSVVSTADVIARAEEIFTDEHIAFVHVRSARNNCFQCRVVRD